MTNEEKIRKLQFLKDHPQEITMYFQVLDEMGDLKYRYGKYLSTNPFDMDQEMERIDTADYELCTGLFAALLREDHYQEGCFKKRLESGQVDKILNRMISQLDC